MTFKNLIDFFVDLEASVGDVNYSLSLFEMLYIDMKE